MSEALRAARFADPVAHSHALTGFLVGAVVGVVAAAAATVVIGAAVAALEVATAGLATPLVIGVAATALEFGANAYVGAKLTEWATEEGERIGSEHMAAPSGQVSQGSPNVFVNARPAARATDTETCDAGTVAQGSETVRFNALPAARVTDKTSCGGQIVDGSANVFIGGPRETVADIQPEVPEWVRWGVAIASVVPAIGQAGRAAWKMAGAIRSQGLVRAAQTGAKSVAQAMEQRGARALARADAGRQLALPAPPKRLALPAPEKRLALPAPEKRPALPPPRPSRYPFDTEPAVPAGGGQKWKFEATRPGLDMDDLSPADAAAARAMERGGWSADTRKQVLDSGRDFDVPQARQGDPMYKFSSAGRDESTSPPSAYYTDEAGYRALAAKHQDPVTGQWNGRGVKNDLALPCYNTADAVWRGHLTTDQPLPRSTINPASETVTHLNPDGSVASVFQREMAGGGTQFTPASGTVGGLSPFNGSVP